MHKKTKAYTFIEMMVVLSIITIMAVLALPRMQSFYYHSHDAVMRQQLIRAIQFARNEARLRHQVIGLCGSLNNEGCANEWAQGQLIFVDDAHDGVIRSREQIVSVFQSAAVHGNLFWRAFPFYRKYLSFMPLGMMTSDNGTFWHCHANSIVWALTINQRGITQVIYPDKQGNVNDSHGHALSCYA